MNGKIAVFSIVTLLILINISGCSNLFQELPTKYESSPTKIRYNFQYGYQINCTGKGDYKIRYMLDLPESDKTLSYNILYPHDYEITSSVNNSFLFWNISEKDSANYKLGILAGIESQNFYVSDLTGNDAMTINEISRFFPNLTNQYTSKQSILDKKLIDPLDYEISTVGNNIKSISASNNSFILAKSIFIWLKENTTYKIHNGIGEVQPARVTLQKRTGDCDDLSFLYISLCRSIGIPARFIRGYLIKSEEEVTATAHAWVEVFVGNNIGNKGWIPVECACCSSSIQADINQNFGLEDAFHLRLFVDDGSNKSMNISQSGIHVQYFEKIDINLESFAIVENYKVLESKQLVVNNENKRYFE